LVLRYALLVYAVSMGKKVFDLLFRIIVSTNVVINTI